MVKKKKLKIEKMTIKKKAKKEVETPVYTKVRIVEEPESIVDEILKQQEEEELREQEIERQIYLMNIHDKYVMERSDLNRDLIEKVYQVEKENENLKEKLRWMGLPTKDSELELAQEPDNSEQYKKHDDDSFYEEELAFQKEIDEAKKDYEELVGLFGKKVEILKKEEDRSFLIEAQRIYDALKEDWNTMEERIHSAPGYFFDLERLSQRVIKKPDETIIALEPEDFREIGLYKLAAVLEPIYRIDPTWNKEFTIPMGVLTRITTTKLLNQGIEAYRHRYHNKR